MSDHAKCPTCRRLMGRNIRGRMLCNAGQWLNTELNVECNRLGFEIVSRERDELRALVERWTTALPDGAAADMAKDDARAWLAAHPKEHT